MPTEIDLIDPILRPDKPLAVMAYMLKEMGYSIEELEKYAKEHEDDEEEVE